MKKASFLLIFVLAFFFLGSQASLAQSDISKDAVPLSPTPVEYQLPYPGLLPDNPLYFLKVARDRIIGFLISDPLKKAEFNLLTADKRLNAGVYLFNSRQGKEDLVLSTISKGENYFEESIIKAREAKKQGMDTVNILRRLSLSAKKHQEVLKELEAKSPKNKKQGFILLEKRVEDFEKTIDELILK